MDTVLSNESSADSNTERVTGIINSHYATSVSL